MEFCMVHNKICIYLLLSLTTCSASAMKIAGESATKKHLDKLALNGAMVSHTASNESAAAAPEIKAGSKRKSVASANSTATKKAKYLSQAHANHVQSNNHSDDGNADYQENTVENARRSPAATASALPQKQHDDDKDDAQLEAAQMLASVDLTQCPLIQTRSARQARAKLSSPKAVATFDKIQSVTMKASIAAAAEATQRTSDGLWKCPHCCHKDKSQLGRDRHKEMHSEEASGQHQCVLCDCYFNNRQTATCHMKTYHQDVINPASQLLSFSHAKPQ